MSFKNQTGTMVVKITVEATVEKEMAPYSSILAWKIPWTEEPGSTVHGVAKGRTQLRTCTHTRSPMRWAVLLYTSQNRGPERLSNLPKVTKLVAGRAGR